MTINKYSGKKYWFFLHPYTFLSVKSHEALLYNTISGEHIITQHKKLRDYLFELSEMSNNYAIKIDGSCFDQAIVDFIFRVRDSFVGDLYEIEDETKKPVQFFPHPILQLKTGNRASNFDLEPVLLEDNYEDYLNSIVLQLTNSCSQNCHICSYAYKQFTCCYSNPGIQHLDINLLGKLLDDLEGNFRLNTMNIIGGNLFHHPDFYRIVNRLEQSKFKKYYTFHYRNLIDCIKNCNFSFLSNELNSMCLIFDFPVDRDWFKQVYTFAAQNTVEPKFSFVLQNDSDIKMLEAMLRDFHIKNIEVLPFYNGNNLDFFKKHVFIESDILKNKVFKMHEIHAKDLINIMKIKKLEINSAGDIFSDINHDILGNINDCSLDDIVAAAFNKKNSAWRQTRHNFKLCSDCVFQNFCPPVSNYEAVIKVPSLCWKCIT